MFVEITLLGSVDEIVQGQCQLVLLNILIDNQHIYKKKDKKIGNAII
jgi:hypothetical protein